MSSVLLSTMKLMNVRSKRIKKMNESEGYLGFCTFLDRLRHRLDRSSLKGLDLGGKKISDSDQKVKISINQPSKGHFHVLNFQGKR
jgi:hypothetical protein